MGYTAGTEAPPLLGLTDRKLRGIDCSNSKTSEDLNRAGARTPRTPGRGGPHDPQGPHVKPQGEKKQITQ